MIILDTNVLSELIRPEPAQAVTQWLKGKTEDPLTTTAITVGEVLYGLCLLPKGRRRSDLELRFHDIIDPEIGLPVLSFDETAARSYGDIAAFRKKAGLPVHPSDIMIAAIAHSQNAAVATRNVKDFKETGVVLINPWDRS